MRLQVLKQKLHNVNINRHKMNMISLGNSALNFLMYS